MAMAMMAVTPSLPIDPNLSKIHLEVNKMASVTIVLPITKVSEDKNGRPFAVANAAELDHGGSVCVFPKKESAKAAKAISNLKVGDTATFVNIGIASGKVYVYDDSTVQVAS
jgi:hypothetical protein